MRAIDRRRIPLFLSILALAVVTGANEPPPTADLLPAARFVEGLARLAELRPAPCVGPAAELRGSVWCGTVAVGHVHQLAQAQALELAEDGVDVLDVQVPLNAPPHQLAELPGFGPAPDLPGAMRLAYLVDRQRVLVWTQPLPYALRGDELHRGRRYLVIRLEPLEGPFPHVLPALRVAGR